MVAERTVRNKTRHQDAMQAGKTDLRLFDDLNIKIVRALISNPDSSSTDIAQKYGIPLSTIQRRRAKLEETVLKKAYSLDIAKLGWRTADLLISVEKGKAQETAEKLLESNKVNVIAASLRIGHPQVDIMADVFYKDSVELHSLTEKVKAMPYVTYVEWAEVVKVVGDNYGNILDKVFSSVNGS